MSLAERIAPTLAARARRAAALQAERERQDALLLLAFPASLSRFDTLLAQALGLHSAIRLTRTPQLLTVVGRSFATLASSTWNAAASFNGVTETVSMTATLDFSGPEQFGRIAVSIDFGFAPTRKRRDRLAQLLLDRGVLLRGPASPSLVLPWPEGLVELGQSELETAFAAWWLR